MESKDDFYRALDSYISRTPHPFILEELKFIGDDLGSPELYFVLYGPIRSEDEFINFCDALVHVFQIKKTISIEKYGKHKLLFPIFMYHKLHSTLESLRIFSGPAVKQMDMAVLELMEMFPDRKILFENAQSIKHSWVMKTFVYRLALRMLMNAPKGEFVEIDDDVVKRAVIEYQKGLLSLPIDIEKVVRFRPLAFRHLFWEFFDVRGPDVFARYCTLVKLVLEDMPPLDSRTNLYIRDYERGEGNELALSFLKELIMRFDIHEGDINLALDTMDRIIGSPYMSNETFVKIEPFLRRFYRLSWKPTTLELFRRAFEKFFNAPKRSRELYWLLGDDTVDSFFAMFFL